MALAGGLGGYRMPPTDVALNRIALEYTHEELSYSTDRFGSSAQLGKGTYGSVYKGTLKDGTEVAIKSLA